MMTLMAKLCALCAISALMQMALGERQRGDGLRMIGGLLMLQLVLSGAKELGERLLAADGLMEIYAILIG